MEQGNFYGRGQFLWQPYGVGQFLRSREISTEEANFYIAGQFLPTRAISMQQTYIRMKNKNRFTEEASFYSRRCLF